MYKLFVKTLPFRQWFIAQRKCMSFATGFLLAMIPIVNIWALAKVISKVDTAMRANTYTFVDKYTWAKEEDWAEHVAQLHTALRGYLFFVLMVCLPYWGVCNVLTDFQHILSVTIGVLSFYLLAILHTTLKWLNEYNYFALWKHAHDLELRQ